MAFSRMCMPLEDLTSKMDSNSKARQLLAKEAVTIWSDDDTGKVDAEMTQLDQVSLINTAMQGTIYTHFSAQIRMPTLNAHLSFRFL